jgi:hypothetical protein
VTAPNDSAPVTPGLIDQDTDRLIQILLAEHSTLGMTRSLTWNEAFARTSTFLSTLSAATVSLALVGPATSFGREFVIFAVVVLSVALFIGLTTFVRLLSVNAEDVYWVFGMNRIRAGLVAMLPGVEKHFIAGYTVDPRGLSRSFAVLGGEARMTLGHLLVTTPAVVLVVDAAMAGAIGALLAAQLVASIGVAIAVGAIVLVGTVALGARYGMRASDRWLALMDERLAADRV